MTEEKLTFDGLLALIESNNVDYSHENKRRVLSSIRRAEKIYGGSPLRHIPADPVAFSEKWGRGRVTDYPVEHFNSPASFKDWRSNVRAAIDRASGARRKRETLDARVDDWTELYSRFDKIFVDKPKHLGFNPKSILQLKLIGRLARDEGLAPIEITGDWIESKRRTLVTRPQKELLGRGCKTLDSLRQMTEFGELLSSEMIGQLEPLRKVRGKAFKNLPAHVSSEWTAYLDVRRNGVPSPISGLSVGISKGRLGQLQAAFGWYLSTAEEIGLLQIHEVSTFSDLAELAQVTAAAQHAHARLGKRGEISPQTVSRYLSCLNQIFQDMNCPVSMQALLKDPLVSRSEAFSGMTPARAAWCRELLRQPRRLKVFFDAPWLLKKKATLNLEQWDNLTQIERSDTLRAGVIATALAILTCVAPLRASNLLGLSTYGDNATFHLPQSAGKPAHILIPASQTKNRKPIEATFPMPRRRAAWEIVSWYLLEIRPRLVDAGAKDNEQFFPGATGALQYGTFLNWFRIETTSIGIPMVPHLVRHAAASAILSAFPAAIDQVAALLGDRVSTVRKHYAWIDQKRIVGEAQNLARDAYSILSKGGKHE